MEAIDKISLFGKGFVGGEFATQFENEVIIQPRDNYNPETPNILNFISTTTNYEVLRNAFLDVETNLITLIKILENARFKFDEVNFTQISSWFVYGDVFLPATENSECKPKGFYSITKYASEMLLRSYCETFGIKYRILRLANVLGKNDRKVSKEKNYTQYLVKQLLRNEPVNIYYGGDFFRDYIDVRDCARAIKLVLDKGNYGEIYNISNGIPIRFWDIVEFLIGATGSKSSISIVNDVKFHKQVQARSMYLDNKKIRKLGYTPNYTVFQSLQEVVDAYKTLEL